MSLNLDKSQWEKVKFGDVVFNVNSTVKDATAAGIDRVIAMEHLDPGELKIQRWGDVAEGTTFTRRVQPGQTLFGKRRAYQRKVAYAEFEAICSGDILTFQANEKRLLPELLPFLVQSDGFFEHALGTSAGSLSPRTNWKDLSNFEFNLPPLHEQKRLANLLWAVEEHKNTLVNLQNNLRKVREQVIEYGLPKNFPETTLSEAASIASGITLGPSRLALPLKSKYLRVANVQRGYLELDEIKEVGISENEIVSKIVKRGDVLVVEGHASVDEIGRAAIWESDENMSFQNHIFRVRAGENYESRFILEWINSLRGRGYIKSVAKSTSGLNTINSTVLKAMPIPEINLESQRDILHRSDILNSGIISCNNEQNKITILQEALLIYIFGGSQ